MLVDDVITRVSAQVEDLAGRVHGAGDLASIVKTGASPNSPVAAFVLPLGLRGGQREVVTGLFRQTITEVVGVLIFVQAPGDATGGSALPTVDALAEAVIAALCGWAPAGAFGVFELERAQLMSVAQGTVTFQVNVSIARQLRIAT